MPLLRHGDVKGHRVTFAVRLGAIASCTLFALACPAYEAAADGGDRLAELIENVKRNESLYDRLEVRFRETYRIQNHAPVTDSRGLSEIIQSEKSIHFVSQDGMFRLEIEGSSRDQARTANRDRVRAFDGTATRLLDQNSVGNVVVGRSEDDNMVRPHMLLMRYSFLMIPLSTLLSGDEAIAAHPSGKVSETLDHRITYEREDEFHGLKCHVVTVASVRKRDGEDVSRREYWLAEDRNYIPVRLLTYRHRTSRDVPGGEGSVDEFREISPGVWFPMLAHFTSYDKLYFEREGEMRVQWREDYVTEEASLEPAYDVTYFQNVEFPDGAAVYEVADGAIQRSYREGAPPADVQRTDRTATREWLILWINLGVGGLLVAGYLIRGRMRAHDDASRQ